MCFNRDIKHRLFKFLFEVWLMSEHKNDRKLIVFKYISVRWPLLQCCVRPTAWFLYRTLWHILFNILLPALIWFARVQFPFNGMALPEAFLSECQHLTYLCLVFFSYKTRQGCSKKWQHLKKCGFPFLVVAIVQFQTCESFL